MLHARHLLLLMFSLVSSHTSATQTTQSRAVARDVPVTVQGTQTALQALRLASGRLRNWSGCATSHYVQGAPQPLRVIVGITMRTVCANSNSMRQCIQACMCTVQLRKASLHASCRWGPCVMLGGLGPARLTSDQRKPNPCMTFSPVSCSMWVPHPCLLWRLLLLPAACNMAEHPTGHQ